MRGAPGNTISHKTSYWVPNQTQKVFVEAVDVVSGVGNDRAAQLPATTTRGHCLGRVISNLAVYDFETPDGAMQLISLHPGVGLEEVIDNTGFPLIVPDEANIAQTRLPTAEELRLIRETIDPEGFLAREVAN